MRTLFASRMLRNGLRLGMILSIIGIAGLGFYQSSAHTDAATACTSTVIKRGSSGTCVTYAQQLLNSSGKAGSTMLVADGKFGMGTDTAARTFQTNNQLMSDGIIGTKSWDALCASPYTGRVSPATNVASIKQSAGCANSLYIASPNITITSPAANASVGGGTLVTSTITDADGVASARLIVDGSVVMSVDKAPYTFYLNTSVLSTGSHSVAIQATDNIGTTATSQPRTISVLSILGDTTSIACATGSNDLGLHTGYNDGVAVPIRLCAVSSLPSTSDESNPAKPYYVAGSNGLAIVNAWMSQQTVSMVSSAKSAGITLRATSVFRTMKHQQDLCNTNAKCLAGDYSAVAQPGYSTHQSGIAIDFAGMTAQGTDMNTCSARAVQPTNATWMWLYKNAETYGLKQYTYESWHWDASNLVNRCGYGQGYTQV